MSVQRSSGRSRLALHVSPVGDGATDFGGRRVAALVLVVDPARRLRIDAQRVAVTLGLSPSEGRTAALLAEGAEGERDRRGGGMVGGLCALADQAGLPEAGRVGAGRAGAPRPGGGRPAPALTARRRQPALPLVPPSPAALIGPQAGFRYLPNGRIYGRFGPPLKFFEIAGEVETPLQIGAPECNALAPGTAGWEVFSCSLSVAAEHCSA